MDNLTQRLKCLSLHTHIKAMPVGVLLAAAHRIEELERSLQELVLRCDGSASMLDGSSIDTRSQHATLGHFQDEEDE